MVGNFSKYFYSIKQCSYKSILRARKVKYHRGKRRIRIKLRHESLFRNLAYFNKEFTRLPRRKKRFVSSKLKLLFLNRRNSGSILRSKNKFVHSYYEKRKVKRKHRRSLYFHQYNSKYNSRNAYIALFLNLLLRRRGIGYRNLWIRRRRLFNSFLAMLRHYAGRRWFSKVESFKEMLFLFRACKSIRTFSDTRIELNRKNFDYYLLNYNYLYNPRRTRTIAVGRSRTRRRIFAKFLKRSFPYNYNMEQYKNLFILNRERQVEYRDAYSDSFTYDKVCIYNNGIYYYNPYFSKLKCLKDYRHLEIND